MNENRILMRWKRGEKALGLGMKSGDPELVELAARMGLDFFSIDGQHGAVTPPQVEILCRIAAGFGITPMMRVPDQSASTLLTYLDRGMQALVVPLMESKAEMEALVRNCYFAPKGLRSATSLNMIMSGGGVDRTTLLAQANENTLIFPQLESRRAYENLDEILSVDGIDFFSGGPEDVAQTYGHPGNPDHPDVIAAIARAKEKVIAAGKGLLDNKIETIKVANLVHDGCAALLKKHGREHRFFRLKT